jgi:uncharacterized protein (TIGR02145 family)
MKTKFSLIAASLSLAMAFTTSCSGEDGKDGNDGAECVLAGNTLICGQNSYTLPTENPGGGGGTSCSISIDAYGTIKQTCGSKVELFAVCSNRVYNTAEYFCEENNVKFNFTDSRDSKEYKAVLIGAQAWMAEDLDYNTSGSSCDDECELGRHYDWETAVTVCPSGWHLPSREEWEVLISFAGGSAVAGKHLKSTSAWAEQGLLDTYGFAATPSGGSRSGWHYLAWTSNKDGSSNAYAFFINGAGVVSFSSVDKDIQSGINGNINVRCIKD